MALASVTREQFKIKSEVEVVHIPTGAVFFRHILTASPMTLCKASGWLGAEAPYRPRAAMPSEFDAWHRSC